MSKLFIVNSTYDGYDSYEISYHKTRKGALRYIMARKYYDWELCRYIVPNSYDDLRMWITERELND